MQHSGSANGTLLATFERGFTDGSPAPAIVRKSTDDGATWSTLATVHDGMTGPGHPSNYILQPILYEFPQQIGAYPAGTLLLTGNVRAHPLGSYFQMWRSLDHGATWTFISTYQTGFIWEPFFHLDDSGRLAIYFADERQKPTYNQFIARITSNDGGNTWSANPDGSTAFSPGLERVVAIPDQTSRPGMPTLTRGHNGKTFLAYEICATSRGACEAYIKSSTNGGASWDSASNQTGTFVQTGDNRYLGSSPYITWTPQGGPYGQLMMAGMRTRFVNTNLFTPEDFQSVFVNRNDGAGAWSWMPAPQQSLPGGTGRCFVNYSPNLLPSADGLSLRYTAASEGSSPCAERTRSGPAGILPYTADFSTGDRGWIRYGGAWSTAGGVYTNSSTGGEKAITGSTAWTDYTLTGDVRFATGGGGNAGFLVRANNPDITGPDSVYGYFVGLRTSGIFIGKQNFSYAEIASAPAALSTNTWYTVQVTVVGHTIHVVVRASGSGSIVAEVTTTDATGPVVGAVGVRNMNTAASWRNVSVAAPTNLLAGRAYTKSGGVDPSFPDTGDAESTDGIIAGQYTDGRSYAYYVPIGPARTAEVTFDLGQARTLNLVRFRQYYDGMHSLAPDTVTVYTSSDGNSWTNRGSTSQADDNRWFSLIPGNVTARYLRFQAVKTNIGGFTDYIFIDELQAYSQ